MAEQPIRSYGELGRDDGEGDGGISPMATSPRESLPIPKARARSTSPRVPSRSRVRKEREEDKPKQTAGSSLVPGFGEKGSTFETIQADNDLKQKIVQQEAALKRMTEQVEEKDALMKKLLDKTQQMEKKIKEYDEALEKINRDEGQEQDPAGGQ